MADSGGHWLNLAEVQKLTQNTLLSGVIDESPKRGGIIDMLGMKQAKGIQLDWNRSNARRTASRTTIGGQLTWSDNVSYSQVSAALKIFYDQTPLNNFVASVYDTHEDYEAQQLLELRTGIVETIEDSFIFDDADYDSSHITGLHHWAIDQTGTDGDIDEAESALNISNVRTQMDYMRYGFDFFYMSFAMARAIEQFYEEGSSGATNIMVGSYIYSGDSIGRRIPFWFGKEVRRSDYMTGETPNSGQGASTRAKDTGETNMSIFMILKGTGAMNSEPGVNIGFGGDKNATGELFRTVFMPDLEDYDADGLRLTSYITLMLGSSLGLGRIHDIESTTAIVA